jgi:murein L,D-transpeptidase YafK
MKTIYSKFLIISLILQINLTFGALEKTIPKDDQKVFPSSLIFLDQFFSHHVILAEKSTHRLHLYKNTNTTPELIKTYQMVTGKKPGNKIFQGDFRTPEGIYHFVDFLPHRKLIERHGKAGEIYGIGAFVMNYPNTMDRFNGKTGGGIWLHSTNDETRIDKGLDSRGCLVAANDNLKEISKYIELERTPIIVIQDLHFISKKTWVQNRKNIRSTLEHWLSAWKNENLSEYLKHYHVKEFKDPYRKNFKGLSLHKAKIFNIPGKPDVSIGNLTVLYSNGYAVAKFKQFYKSKAINDTGLKTLYLKKDEYYRWKIVSENWSKLNEPDKKQIASFTPSMRFFKAEAATTINKENN